MASAFESACGVEARAFTEYLAPFLRLRSTAFITTAKGRLSRELQVRYGDVIMNAATSGDVVAVELKAEERHTGNLFLEMWSNRGTKRPGWMIHLDADWLLYFFLESEMVYCFDLPTLQDWAFGKEPGQGRIYRYREARQSKYDQHNDTWGRLVPVARLLREVQPSSAWDLSVPEDPARCDVSILDRDGVPGVE